MNRTGNFRSIRSQTPAGNVQDIVHDPQSIAEMTLGEIAERRAAPNSGLRLNNAEVDRQLLPLRPGELVSVIGLTGNYKSGVMQYLARQAIRQIRPDEVVIYATWEQAVEEHALVELAGAAGLDAVKLARGEVSEAEWDALSQAATRRSVTPLWILGHSIQGRHRRPHLTIDDIGLAMRVIEEDWGFKPGLICLDYLQRIESREGGGDRRLEQMHIVDRAKDMALACACPVLLGVQAKQDVMDRKWKLPGPYDAQETSNVAQASDKILSVWYPKMTEETGSLIYKSKATGTEYRTSDHLLVLSIQKQKFGPAPAHFFLRVDPGRNQISSYARE